MITPLPKIAIVYDQATDEGYGDNILSTLTETFPGASVYTPPKVHSIFKQKLHITFPKLRLGWFKKLDVSAFDIIISYGSSFTKHVQKTRNDQTLIHYSDAPAVASALKKIDFEAAQNVDIFIATSSNAQRGIKAFYNKPSTVVHPPVNTSQFTPARSRDDYYVIIDPKTPESQIDLAITSTSKLDIKLKIFSPSDSEATLHDALNDAKGFLSLTAKDFDIRQVEALAAGTPIVAYSTDSKTDVVQDSETGILFHELTTDAIVSALREAESRSFLPGTLRRKAKRFDKGLFVTKLHKIVIDSLKI